MQRVLIDENFDHDLLRALRARSVAVFIDVRDVGLEAVADEEILEWAAQNQLPILTQDKATMIGFAYARLAAGLPMPGCIAIPQLIPIRVAIDELMLILGAGNSADVDGQVLHVPLR